MPVPQSKSQQKPTSKRKGVHVSNLAKLDAEKPIPFEHAGMAFSYVNQTKYIPFLPPEDNFAQTLLEIRYLSATHNACICTKMDYCGGNGFHDADNKPLPDNIMEWFSNMNLHNETSTEITQNIFEDLFTYGNVPVELVRFEVAGKKHFLIYVHSFLEWRLCKPNNQGIATEAVHSRLFLRKAYLTGDDFKNARILPIYSPRNSEKQNWKKEDGAERTMIWLKNRVTGYNHYGLPESIAALVYQYMEYKGARYNIDNFDNNMVVASILALKGQLGADEAARIGKQITNQHTGDGKRGRTIVLASEEGIEGSNFHKLDTKTDGSYNELDDKSCQKIILAHRWDAILAGIISPSTLGKGAGFVTKILEIKTNTVIKPAQEKLMLKLWNIVFKLSDEWMKLGLNKYKLAIKNSIDISGLTDVDITPAVQINEVRQAKGLPVDPKRDGEYMKSTGPAPKAEKEDENV